MQAVRSFVVNVLDRSQEEIALRFANKGEGKFDGLETARSRQGHPVLFGSHVSFECRVMNQMRSGTHVIFIAEVEGIVLGNDTSPLTYHSGRFGRFLELPRFVDKMIIQAFGSSHEHDLW